MQRQTLAKLIQMAFILLLFAHPGGNIILNIQRYVQGGADLQPLFSECLLFLREGLYFLCLALDLLGERIHLPEHQQSFLF
ncbi:Uncharacterised protein [Enterobacter cloacae]|nr:Uncharacterised protein [Enterobacter cloacae]